MPLFVDQLVWDDADNGELEQQSPDLEMIDERIRQLDGLYRTVVTLYGATGGSCLTLGGSSDSGLIVYVAEHNQRFYQLKNPQNAAAEDRIVVAAGQPGQYPARDLVPLSDALKAARAYAHNGTRAAELTWEET
jgi:hypothetical protein